MKAASSLAAIALLLGGCAFLQPPAPVAAPAVVAPVPVDYTCDQQRQLGRELAALPGTMIETALDDYGVERRKLRAVLGLPEPKACSDPGA